MWCKIRVCSHAHGKHQRIMLQYSDLDINISELMMAVYPDCKLCSEKISVGVTAASSYNIHSLMQHLKPSTLPVAWQYTSSYRVHCSWRWANITASTQYVVFDDQLKLINEKFDTMKTVKHTLLRAVQK